MFKDIGSPSEPSKLPPEAYGLELDGHPTKFAVE